MVWMPRLQRENVGEIGVMTNHNHRIESNSENQGLDLDSSHGQSRASLEREKKMQGERERGEMSKQFDKEF